MIPYMKGQCGRVITYIVIIRSSHGTILGPIVVLFYPNNQPENDAKIVVYDTIMPPELPNTCSPPSGGEEIKRPRNDSSPVSIAYSSNFYSETFSVAAMIPFKAKIDEFAVRENMQWRCWAIG